MDMIPSRFHFAPPCFDHSRDETTEPDFSRPPARGLSRVTPARFGRAPERAIARRHQGRRFIPAPRVSAALSDGFVETIAAASRPGNAMSSGISTSRSMSSASTMRRLICSSGWPRGGAHAIALDILYRREFRAGEGFIIRSAVVEAVAATGSDRARGHSFRSVTRASPGRACPCSRSRPRRRGADTRRPRPWPGSRFRPCAGRRARERFPRGATGSSRGDGSRGQMRLPGYLHRFSNACLHVIEAVGMSHAYRRTPSAASPPSRLVSRSKIRWRRATTDLWSRAPS